ncbi:hypothetical protein [Ornithinimicrobium sufpigmenti]|uniref:hypothetical protein n=1 Tax=Ornithinimicrobium sufpigmenti TaxID=2508882 RepID=UPI001036A979|nr:MULTISPECIES: hypothetical protein [unclassified Ornithinimicrobium]
MTRPTMPRINAVTRGRTSNASRRTTGTTGPAGGARWRSRRRTLGLVGAVAAAGMTALWVVVVPEKASTTDGLQSAAIRLGHPLSWALLSAVGLAVAAGAPKDLRDGLAWAALAAYGAFLLALLL